MQQVRGDSDGRQFCVACQFVPGRRADQSDRRGRSLGRAAQAIELVDGQGNVRAQLHLGPDGSGNIRLRDGNGEVRVKLGTSVEGGTALLLMDKKTEPVVRLATDKEGTGLKLIGPDKKERMITP